MTFLSFSTQLTILNLLIGCNIARACSIFHQLCFDWWFIIWWFWSFHWLFSRFSLRSFLLFLFFIKYFPRILSNRSRHLFAGDVWIYHFLRFKYIETVISRPHSSFLIVKTFRRKFILVQFNYHIIKCLEIFASTISLSHLHNIGRNSLLEQCSSLAWYDELFRLPLHTLI